MSIKNDRRRVRIASAQLLVKREEMHRRADWLASEFEHYRPALLVGGGLLAGFFLGRGKLSSATRSIVSAASVGMSLMRSSFGSMLLAKTLRRPDHASPRTPVSRAQG